jgi:hypothetical protein
MSKPKRFKWVVEIEVDEKWVADGFDLTNENITDRFQDMLPYATSNEVSGKILKAPSKKAIRVVQGYEI